MSQSFAPIWSEIYRTAGTLETGEVVCDAAHPHTFPTPPGRSAFQKCLRCGSWSDSAEV